MKGSKEIHIVRTLSLFIVCVVLASCGMFEDKESKEYSSINSGVNYYQSYIDKFTMMEPNKSYISADVNVAGKEEYLTFVSWRKDKYPQYQLKEQYEELQSLAHQAEAKGEIDSDIRIAFEEQKVRYKSSLEQAINDVTVMYTQANDSEVKILLYNFLIYLELEKNAILLVEELLTNPERERDLDKVADIVVEKREQLQEVYQQNKYQLDSKYLE